MDRDALFVCVLGCSESFLFSRRDIWWQPLWVPHRSFPSNVCFVVMTTEGMIAGVSCVRTVNKSCWTLSDGKNWEQLSKKLLFVTEMARKDVKCKSLNVCEMAGLRGALKVRGFVSLSVSVSYFLERLSFSFLVSEASFPQLWLRCKSICQRHFFCVCVVWKGQWWDKV